jgi:hypothetical protein
VYFRAPLFASIANGFMGFSVLILPNVPAENKNSNQNIDK